MREEELINHFGKEERYSNNYSNFIDQDALAKNDFYHYKKGYELGIKELEKTKSEHMAVRTKDFDSYFELRKELETTKKQLDEAVVLLEYSESVLESEGYDMFIPIKKFLAKLSKEDRE